MSSILKTYKARAIKEGAGVIVNRVFGYGQTKEFDPFLMLDYFETDSNEPSKGFPWHPHKGIETITYMLRGNIEHQDTLGNKGIIGGGELQWMTAGRGIMHEEMPKPSTDGYQGFQFWLNLKSTQKLTEPKYRDVKKNDVKSVIKNGVEVRVISGQYGDVFGPIDKSDLGVTMLHFVIDKDREVVVKRAADKQGFIFIFKGEGTLNKNLIQEVTAYTLSDGDYVYKATMDTEFIYAEGIPLKEPIAWYGPVVMNTREEIEETFNDINNGTFIKK
jgi:redox-sensitive bicupin YhaK (pirin superfamily)